MRVSRCLLPVRRERERGRASRKEKKDAPERPRGAVAERQKDVQWKKKSDVLEEKEESEESN